MLIRSLSEAADIANMESYKTKKKEEYIRKSRNKRLFSDNQMERSLSFDASRYARDDAHVPNMNSHLANEKKAREKRDKRTRRSFQALTFFLCCLKLFIISAT